MTEYNIEEHICKMLKEWINHSKEGYRRNKSDLLRFDKFWNFITECILESDAEENNEELKDFSRLVKYEGTLYRYHRIKKSNKYVEYDDHYASWTTSDDPTVMYWIHRNEQLVKITAEVKKDSEIFGISLSGLESYIRKYWYPSFIIGSPAIHKEQEVVFRMNSNPVQSENIIIVK